MFFTNHIFVLIIMDLHYMYTAQRSELGKQPMYCFTAAQLVDSIVPDMVEARKYILRNPVHQPTQHTAPISQQTINTERSVLPSPPHLAPAVVAHGAVSSTCVLVAEWSTTTAASTTPRAAGRKTSTSTTPRPRRGTAVELRKMIII